MNTRWRIELFSGVRAEQGERVLTRFRTQKTAALLAYLAYYHDRKHPREVLFDVIWPESHPRTGRLSLRVELSSLRRQLEPPGVPSGAVLVADRHSVHLNSAAVTTDVAEFQSALQAAARTDSDKERIQFLTTAVELYRGELLHGFFEEWIEPERQRLTDTYLNALRRLTTLLTQARQFDRALDCARRAVQADPLDEESHRALMQLYSAVRRPASAWDQFQELERILKKELGVAPSAATRTLAREISEQLVVVGNGRAVVKQQKADKRQSGTKGEGEKGRKGKDAHSPTHPFAHSPILQFPASIPQPSSFILHPSTAGSLPLQFTRFFGRDKEIKRLEALLLSDATRLVTLTGAGGSGKTRLAIELGKRLQERLEGGVWFVPLADVADPRLIADTVRDTLRLPRVPDVRPVDQIVDALSRQRSLLILDNVEHLLSTGFGSGLNGLTADSRQRHPFHPLPKSVDSSHPSSFILTLIERVPALTCLITSRQRLDIGGECAFPIPPLPIPRDEWQVTGDETMPFPVARHSSLVTPESLMRFASMQLFMDRAQAVRPDFQVTQRNAPAVAELCQRLEGIPLAIELAAAWAQTLTVGQMLSRLSRRFDLLVSRRKDLPERHRALWATVEWSYRLLSPELRQFFARLSVFRGGWTLEAAEAVCFVEGSEQPSTLNPQPSTFDALRQLRERSLIVAEEVGSEMRYRLLETLREFAAEQLTSDEQSVLAQRHARYFLRLAEESEAHLAGAEQRAWLDRLEVEHDNLRAAIEWSLQQTEPSASLRLVGALSRFWFMRGHFPEGQKWLRQALERVAEGAGDACPQIESPRTEFVTLGSARAKATQGLGVLTWQEGDYQTTRALLEQSLTLYRALEDQRGIAGALHHLANIVCELGEHQVALPLYEESLAIRRAIDDREGVARSLAMLGRLVSVQGCETGHGMLEESLALFRSLENRWGAAWTLNMMGDVACGQQNYDMARTFYGESHALFQEMDDKRGVATCLSRRAAMAAVQSQYAEARNLFAEGMLLYHEIGVRGGVFHCLAHFASLAVAEEQWERAICLEGAVSVLSETLSKSIPLSLYNREKNIATGRARLGEKTFAAAWRRGRTMTTEQMIQYALDASEASTSPCRSTS